ncbi:hypothetical protein D9M68_482270 [compost metagenome]
MELYYDKDKLIRGDWIKRAVLRSDLVPVPLTLEAVIRVDADSRRHFETGRALVTYAGDELEIIHSELSVSGAVQGSEQAASVRLIAILKCVKAVAFVKPTAIIKANASLAEVYRAAGATLRGIEGDFPVPRFVCMAGEVPTFHIARALQEGGGVVRWRNGRLAFIPLRGLFQQKTVTSVTDSAADDVESGFLERHEIPWFYSVDADGRFVYGNRNKARAARWQPGMSEIVLRNMTACLVHTKTTIVKYNERLAAGDLVEVQGGSPLTIMTSATLFAAGTDGDPPQQYTRLWLGRLEA